MVLFYGLVLSVPPSLRNFSADALDLIKYSMYLKIEFLFPRTVL